MEAHKAATVLELSRFGSDYCLDRRLPRNPHEFHHEINTGYQGNFKINQTSMPLTKSAGEPENNENNMLDKEPEMVHPLFNLFLTLP